MLKKLPLEANGHEFSRIREISEVEVLELDTGGPPLVFGLEFGCAFCNQRPKLHVTDTAVHVQSPCPYPHGITTEVLLKVPSGKLLVSDSLRPVYDWDDTGLASYNTVLGQSQAIKAMEAIGCAFGTTGNHGLGLYRSGVDTYVIANPGYDGDDNPLLPDSDRAAEICTDLWAYSCADYEHWESRGGDPTKLGYGDTIVDVTPGTYRFVYHGGERDFDRDAEGTVVFADIERVE